MDQLAVSVPRQSGRSLVMASVVSRSSAPVKDVPVPCRIGGRPPTRAILFLV